MTRFRTVASTALVAGMLLFAISGCEKGSAEKAGESIDKSLEKIGDDIDESVEKIGKSLEETGESIQDAGRTAGD